MFLIELKEIGGLVAFVWKRYQLFPNPKVMWLLFSCQKEVLVHV